MDGMAEDEAAQLVGKFRLLGVTPKGDNPEQIQDWMVDYLKNVGKFPEEKPTVVPDTLKTSQTAVHVSTRVPNISLFSGSPTANNENFDIWKYEVECLLCGHQYPIEAVVEAVRRSLKGEAANVVKRLGINASISDIIAKLAGVFGNVILTENLLAEFYSTRKKPGEDVSRWSCRLEDILDQANTQKTIAITEQREMLRNKLYSGLTDALKSRCGHLFYNINDYDELRINLRRVEQEMKPTSKDLEVCTNTFTVNKPTTVSHAAIGTKSKHDRDVHDVRDKISLLEEQNEILRHELSMIKARQQTCSTNTEHHIGVKSGHGGNNYRGQGQGHYYSNKPNNPQNNRSSTGYQGSRNNTSFSPQIQPENGYYNQNPHHFNHVFNPQAQPFRPHAITPRSLTPASQGYQPQCWRCGQIGHRQYRCTVILNKPLNWTGSTIRG